MGFFNAYKLDHENRNGKRAVGCDSARKMASSSCPVPNRCEAPEIRLKVAYENVDGIASRIQTSLVGKHSLRY